MGRTGGRSLLARVLDRSWIGSWIESWVGSWILGETFESAEASVTTGTSGMSGSSGSLGCSRDSISGSVSPWPSDSTSLSPDGSAALGVSSSSVARRGRLGSVNLPGWRWWSGVLANWRAVIAYIRKSRGLKPQIHEVQHVAGTLLQDRGTDTRKYIEIGAGIQNRQVFHFLGWVMGIIFAADDERRLLQKWKNMAHRQVELTCQQRERGVVTAELMSTGIAVVEILALRRRANGPLREPA